MNQFDSDEAPQDPDFLSCAVAVANTIEGDEYSEIIEAIAGQYAERGELDLAIERAESIPDPYLRDRARGVVAIACIDADSFDIAEELCEEIEDPMLLELANEQIAVKYAQRGEFEKGVGIASELVDSGPVLGNIAVIYATEGLAAEALDLAQSIENPTTRATSLAQLASAANTNGNADAARELLAEATTATDDIEVDDELVFVLINIASVYESIGDKQSAFDNLSQAYEVCGQLSDTDEGMTPTSTRDEALVQIVAGLTQIKFFDTADKVIEDIEDPFQFAHAAIKMADGYQSEGRESEANDLLSQAIEISREEKVYGEQGDRMRDRVLLDLWRLYVTRENLVEANKIASSINSTQEQQRARVEIGRAAARSGAEQMGSQVAASIDGAVANATYWLAMSEAWSGPEHAEQVESAISKARTNAEAIDLPYDRCLVLAEIAVRLLAMERSDEGGALLTRAVETVADIEGSYRQTLCLLNLAYKYRNLSREPNQKEQQVLREIVASLE